jgi:[acyl-carrier-protein] S-malonyltransferase
MGQIRDLAFVFPGQGSQKVGMLRDIAEKSPTVIETFAQASEVLGYDLWDLIQAGPQDALNMTETTQPALLTSSVALWRVWLEREGAEPSFMAGHSLGEWSALVCAGVVDFSDAVRLVRARGRYMQEAVPAGEGAMAAIIGLDDAAVEKACADAAQGEVVAPVNYNSPGQLVIAGAAGAVDRAMVLCQEAGAKRALPLPVSAPFHTTLMKPAADRLAAEIEATAFSAPRCTVIHNVTAASESSPEAIKELMIKQIYSPVLWVDCVNQLAQQGVKTVVECGPGKVLSGLNKRIARDLAVLATENEVALADALASVGK